MQNEASWAYLTSLEKKEKPSSTSNHDSSSAKGLLANSMDLLCQDKSLEEVKAKYLKLARV